MGQLPSKKKNPALYPLNPAPGWNQGYLPPNVAAMYQHPGMQMPVPMMAKSTSKKSKSKSSHTGHNKAASFPVGFVPYTNQAAAAIAAQQPGAQPFIPTLAAAQGPPHHAHASGNAAPTPITFAPATMPTPTPAARRAPTPYVRTQPTPSPTTPSPSQQHQSSYVPHAQFPMAPPVIPPAEQSHTPAPPPMQPQYQTQSPFIPDEDFFRRTRPHTPPNNANVYGPPQHPAPQTPISNPLPPPPRDLYEFSPYKNLLDLPHTTALLSARRDRANTVGPEVVNVGPNIMQPGGAVGAFTVSRAGTKRKGGGGLFRGLSSRKKDKEPETRYIYMHVPGNVPVNPADPVSLSRAASMQSVNPGSQLPMNPPNAPVIPQHTGSQGQHHHPPPQGSVEKLYFSHLTPLAAFLNHSRHRILYGNKIYPTATHLHEALKYLPHRADLAEALRNTENVEDVYRLSEQWENEYGTEGAGVRRDWRNVFLSMMEEVLYLKFKQHPDLRQLLMNTGDAEIVYSDEHDSYWGDGLGTHGSGAHGDDSLGLNGLVGTGLNELGKALVRVRSKLRQEGFH